MRRLPPSAELMAEAAGAGSSLGDIVLVPKLAYLTLRSAGWNSSSDHQSVIARLAKSAPEMTVRPLPVIDGKPVEN